MLKQRLRSRLGRIIVLLLLLHLLQAVLTLPARGGSITSCEPAHACSGNESRLAYRSSRAKLPALEIEPYVRPEFTETMDHLRPVILAAATRHNRPELSGMSDTEFASILALLLYNEHNGWLEDDIEPLRIVTPLYQISQVYVNQVGVGSNFSVWPANIRPSVALEILRQQVPVPAPTNVLTVPLTVAGSQIVVDPNTPEAELFAAISHEISQDTLAVEYLAANLERGVYRCQYEGVPVSWRTLAAWHNQGIVQPTDIAQNSIAFDYVRRTSAYLLLAHHFMYRTEDRVQEASGS
ncbi:MAG: hypothetical protein HC837_11430 [Chloroflexaceae bacterium]|nr:hypothetical protein [Chloroflexaceae bacterium]